MVARRTDAAGLPVLANVDIGHTDPILTLPIGCRAVVDADAERFETLEPPTRAAVHVEGVPRDGQGSP